MLLGVKTTLLGQGKRRTSGAGPSTALRFAQDDNRSWGRVVAFPMNPTRMATRFMWEARNDADHVSGSVWANFRERVTASDQQHLRGGNSQLS